MKKIFVFIFLLFCFDLFSLVELNDYYDYGLVEKNGTYGVKPFFRKNSFVMGGVFTSNNDSFSEWFTRLSMYIDPPELYGFVFNVDATMQRTSLSTTRSSEFDKLLKFAFNYGENYLGFINKYVSIKFGFQNLVSSDAIYNHLLIDDYSGAFFAFKTNILLSRYVDVEILYNIVRPQNSIWTTSIPDKDPNSTYSGLYGKSLFTKKINFRPLPWIRFGLTDAVYFLGENFNIWFINPLSMYYFTVAMGDFFKEKYGSQMNTQASNVMFTLDFNIGFDGWRIYGEALIDDSDAYYTVFNKPRFPDRVAFLLGGELRGYLFTKYFKIYGIGDYILSNMYVNFEYGIASKSVFSRDANVNYEFIRQEYVDRFNPKNPPTKTEADMYNRTGNFIGFMYGNNSDSIDIAVGFRSDLKTVKEYKADYQGDVYFDSFKKKPIPDRLFKMQLHYRFYRFGDERNVIVPFYNNEHYYYDEDPNLDTNGDGIPDNDSLKGVGGSDSPFGESKSGTNRRTEFIRIPVMIGNILDFSFYSDIFRISKFVFGFENTINFHWKTYNPFSSGERTDFVFKFDFAFTLSW